ITHHSNYIRWMEEARMDFLEQIGWPYEKLEEDQIISPVTSVDCKYRMTTTFADEIEIEVGVKEFKGIRLIFEYVMKKAGHDGIVCTGHSEHCFLDNEGKIIRLKKQYPQLAERLMKLANRELNIE
ncbi:MAG: acyl-CoA thioesterase, partial [Cellulosilyticum sp.]|nr:acyl-CoA thioesterase [Cellulosilyticum sp.]